MNVELLKRYFGKHVFLTLKNGFSYKFALKKEHVINNALSFIGKFGEPVTFEVAEISFITISEDERKKLENDN